MTEKNLCILGNGAAAMEAVKGLRACGYAGGIDLIADALWPTYNPMLTTYYLAGKIDFSGLFPYGYGREIYEELAVNLHLGSPVTALDTKEKSITVASGKTYDYSQCLIATGASPFCRRCRVWTAGASSPFELWKMP